MTRAVILAGGFGGMYAALGFERLYEEGCEVTLVDVQLKIADDDASGKERR